MMTVHNQEHGKTYIIIDKIAAPKYLDLQGFCFLKKTRIVATDSTYENKDQIATSVMNQPTRKEEHNYG